MAKEIKIENVTIYVVETYNPYHWAYLALEPMEFEAAQKLCPQGKTFLAHAWNFWGDAVFTLNYIDEEHCEKLIKFLVDNGVGSKRSKQIADKLINNYKYGEDLQGVKMD